MSARRAVVVLAGLALLLVAAPSGAETYRNREYGFRVELPAGHAACRSESYQHDTGILILLGGKPKDCAGPWDGPQMTAGATYNALFWADLTPAIRMACDPKDGIVVAAPSGLVIKGQRTAACRVDSANGSISIQVFALAVTRPPPRREPEDFAPMIEYHLWLRTRPERFDADLALFRAFLKSYRLFKPGG